MTSAPPPNAPSSYRPCGAARKRDGQPCTAPAMQNGRCRVHGGKSRAGVASPTWRHGGSSRYLSTDLVADFRAALADPELLDLTRDLALLEARLGELLRQAAAADYEAAWARFAGVWPRFAAARRASDVAGMQAAMAELQRAYDEGPAPTDAWERIGELIDRRRRLVATEQQRRVAMREMVTGERFMAFTAVMAESIRRHVPDAAARQAIVEDMHRLLGRPAETPD
jgi:hypothetical protein